MMKMKNSEFERACIYARYVGNLVEFGERRPAFAVEIAEKYVAGKATYADLRRATYSLQEYLIAARGSAARRAATPAAYAAAQAAYAAVKSARPPELNPHPVREADEAKAFAVQAIALGSAAAKEAARAFAAAKLAALGGS
jgi:hypothetical protein